MARTENLWKGIGSEILAESPTNCDAHLAESLFQTRSREAAKSNKQWE
ncbi:MULTISPECIES: DUF6783 domain-containing protein [unclassified Ruminococcus]